MADFDLADFASLDPQQLAKLVKSTPDSKIKEVLGGEHRAKVLNEIFGQIPRTFRPEQAGPTNAVIHWNIGGRPDGGTDTYELVIANGTCTLSPSPQHEPKLSLTIGPVEFIKLISGTANPVMMFMTGRLKAKGDLSLATNIANFFAIPKA